MVIERDSLLHPLQWARRIYPGSCESMAEIPDEMVQCVVTSPPYDGVRTYDGHSLFDIGKVAGEIYRVLEDGGICCWVVQDQTKDFAKSGTSARTAVLFMDLGFKLFETLVYKRHGRPGPWWNHAQGAFDFK